MKIAVFGATARTGLPFIDQALAAGHEVTAYVRSPEKLEERQTEVRVVEGDLEDEGAIAEAVKGQDAVVCFLGTVDRKRNTVLSDGTRRILDAMKAAGVDRFGCVTSLGCRDSLPQMKSLMIRFVIGVVAKEIWADKNRQEDVIEQSGVNYTIVRPGRLTEGEATGDYRIFAQGEPLPKKVAASRADVAAYLLKSLSDPAAARKIVAIG